MRRYVGPVGCAGCGTPGSERWRPGKSAICEDCTDMIELGRGVVRENRPGVSRVILRRYESMFDSPRVSEWNKKRRHFSTISGLNTLPYVTNHDGQTAGSVDALGRPLGGKRWYLVWYGPDAEPGYLSVNYREILTV